MGQTSVGALCQFLLSNNIIKDYSKNSRGLDVSKKGLLTKIADGFKNSRSGMLGVTFAAGLSSGKSFGAETPHLQSVDIQSYAASQNIETELLNSAQSKAEVYQAFVAEHGLQDNEIESLLNYEPSNINETQAGHIVTAYEAIQEQHDNRMITLLRTEMKNPDLEGQDKLNMLQDRKAELQNLYGDDEHYQYKHSEHVPSSLHGENAQFQNLFEQSLNGEDISGTVIVNNITVEDVGGLAVYASLEQSVRDKVIDGFIQSYEPVFEAEVEMDRVDSQMRSENKFRSPFGGPNR